MYEHILKFAVTSCLHMGCATSETDLHPTLGSGVIISYRDKFFLCTVSHFVKKEGVMIFIYTGLSKDGQTMVWDFESTGFTYIRELKFEFEDEPDAEDIVCFLENPINGTYFDIAYREIPLLKDIKQDKKEIEIDGFGVLHIPEDGKTMPIINKESVIELNIPCCFFGRIRPDTSKGYLDFKEMLYSGLPITDVSENYIGLDLGAPIADHDRFRGCSGAPIIDNNGNLVALLAYGPKDVNQTIIYGFRFDVLKKWIDRTHFSLL